MKTRPVVLHLEGVESDRDALLILDRIKHETGRDGALGSILDATVRRGLQRAITRQRRALAIQRWRTTRVDPLPM